MTTPESGTVSKAAQEEVLTSAHKIWPSGDGQVELTNPARGKWRVYVDRDGATEKKFREYDSKEAAVTGMGDISDGMFLDEWHQPDEEGPC